MCKENYVVKIVTSKTEHYLKVRATSSSSALIKGIKKIKPTITIACEAKYIDGIDPKQL